MVLLVCFFCEVPGRRLVVGQSVFWTASTWLNASFTLAAEEGGGGLDEEVTNLARRGVTGRTKAGFVARDDLVNERMNMWMREFG